MEQAVLRYFDDCMIYIKKLEMQNSRARDEIRKCVSGDLLDEYLKSCHMVENHIKKMDKELKELKEYLMLLEHQ